MKKVELRVILTFDEHISPNHLKGIAERVAGAIQNEVDTGGIAPTTEDDGADDATFTTGILVEPTQSPDDKTELELNSNGWNLIK